MKTPNADLFDLIKSLNKNEKRFFKLFAALQSGEKNYLKLFDAVEKQTTYDEADIKKDFHGEKFIRQLTFTKDYLYNIILRSLHAYHSGATAEDQIMELIRTSKLLYDKALYRQCQKIIRKARELASLHDKYALLLETLDVEKQLHIRQKELPGSESILKEILHEEMEVLRKLSNQCRYWNLQAALMRVSTHNWRPRNEEQLLPFDEIIRNPLMTGEEKPEGFESTYYYLHIKGMYHYFRRDFNVASEYLEKAVDHLYSRKEYVKANQVRYLLARTNVVLVHLEAGDYKKAGDLLEKIREDFLSRKMDASVRIRFFLNYYNYILNICLNTCEIEKGIAIVKEIEQWLEENEQLLAYEPKMVLSFNLSILQFTAGNYHQALRWLNRILTSDQLRIDLNSFVRIFDLIIHFELQNHTLIDYKAKSVYRFLYKRKRLYKFETVVLDFIKKYSGIRTKEEEMKLFKEFRSILEDLSHDPFEKEALDRFDFIAWLDSKILKKPFLEVVREKAAKVK